ncbi:hypothetical protein TNCV_2142641 [Trichonephila clavipes]|nr:hypothetical protein TNCV_2142641 [Trichonephila clavipes]
MAAEWTGLVSSQAKPVEVYSQKVMPGVMRKWATASALSRCLGIEPTMARVSKDLSFLGHGSIFVNVCGNNTFCCSEGQRDFRLRRLGSLLCFLIDSLIAVDPNMTWERL